MVLFGLFGSDSEASGTRVVTSHPFTRTSADPSPFVNNRISNTKYSLVTFLPLNLYHQFKQPMNRYFLLIACLQLWSSITPVAPITTWGPLAVIFAISGLKEAVDDIKRYRNDCLANERLVTVLRDGHEQQIEAQHLLVGDIIYCEENDEIPADIVLLKSSEDKSASCYIQTANLDGETNLKQRFAAHKDHLQGLDDAQLFQLAVTIECAQPNKNLYNFDSTLKIPQRFLKQGAAVASSSSASSGSGDAAFPLTGDNMLLQATYLRNTNFIYGLVVYTGNETKVGCNKSKPQVKSTKIDDIINQATIVIFALQILLIIIWGVVGSHRQNVHKGEASDIPPDGPWYLEFGMKDSAPGWVEPLVIPLRFLLLASMMIPISLKVSLDVVKLYYSMLISWDIQMYDPTRDVPSKATNTSIAENLGQVSYVLSDKTGTLTENVMIFRQMCTAGGKRYGAAHGPQSPANAAAAAVAAAAAASAGIEPSVSGASAGETNRRPSIDKRQSVSSSSDAGAAVGIGILEDNVLVKDLNNREASLMQLLRCMALCNTVVPSWVSKDAAKGPHGKIKKASLPPSSPSSVNQAPAIYAPSPNRPQSLAPIALSKMNNSLEMVESQSGGVLNIERGNINSARPEPLFGVAASAPSNSVLRKQQEQEEQDEDPHSSIKEAFASGHIASDSVSDFGLASETALAFTPSSSFTQLPRGSTYGQLVAQQSLLNAGKGRHVHYASSSPDELSLVEFAAQAGVRLIEKEGMFARMLFDPRINGAGISDSVPLSASCIDERWEIRSVLEFSSERKRMSVVMRQVAPTPGKLMLVTKGADDVIFARLDKSPQSPNVEHIPQFKTSLEAYANQGLRTLCFAWRPLDESEFVTWSAKLQAANLDIHNRAAAVAAVYELLERDLELVGCSGIEDALQDQVPQTIALLRQANIKVWLITGDKRATALEISKSCELYKPLRERGRVSSENNSGSVTSVIEGDGDVLYTIEGTSAAIVKANLDQVASRALNASNEPNHRFCMLVDGATLPLLLGTDLEDRFASVALQAISVICCRTTPAQKASMVKLVQEHSVEGGGVQSTSTPTHLCSLFSSVFSRSQGKVVLGIGDGGNDVSMIQQADVGVGIVGREGLQASRAADFSFSRFSYLQRLLFIHGRYSYNRTAFVSQYCFFKSMLICMVQLFFAFSNDWSGASYFDSFSLTTYNLFYTSLPTLLFVLEQDLSPRLLLNNPQLYASSQEGTLFNFYTFSGWLLRAVVQSIFLIAFATQTHHGEVGSMAFGAEGQLSNSLVIYTACVLIHPFTIYLESTYITLQHHIVLVGTVLLFLVLNCILSVLSPGMDLWHVYILLLKDSEYYLRVIVLTSICVIPVFVYKFVQTHYYPTIVQRAHEVELLASREKELISDAELAAEKLNENKYSL